MENRNGLKKVLFYGPGIVTQKSKTRMVKGDQDMSSTWCWVKDKGG